MTVVVRTPRVYDYTSWSCACKTYRIGRKCNVGPSAKPILKKHEVSNSRSCGIQKEEDMYVPTSLEYSTTGVNKDSRKVISKN